MHVKGQQCCYAKTIWPFYLCLASDTNECESNPCQNNGICVDYINKYVCFCTQKYFGANCEKGKYKIWPKKQVIDNYASLHLVHLSTFHYSKTYSALFIWSMSVWWNLHWLYFYLHLCMFHLDTQEQDLCESDKILATVHLYIQYISF